MSSKGNNNPRSFVYTTGSKRDRHGVHVDIDLESILATMQGGHYVMEIKNSRQYDIHPRSIRLHSSTRQIHLYRAASKDKKAKDLVPIDNSNEFLGNNVSKPLKTIDVNIVKEVSCMELDHKGKLSNSRIIDRWRRDGDISQLHPAKFLIIFFGQSFVLDLLYCMFDSAEACIAWVRGLRYLVHEVHSVSYSVRTTRWLHKQYRAITQQQNTSIAASSVVVKDLKQFLRRMHYQVDSKQFRDLMQRCLNVVSPDSSLICLKDAVDFESFASLYRELIYVHSIFSSNFTNYCCTDSGRITPELFAEFMRSEQNDQNLSSIETATAFLNSYIKQLDPSRQETYITKDEFLDYLFCSSFNSIWNANNDQVVQDMDQPMCNYWIASSHNTYLTGDQIRSESSLDAYARVLAQGCRCIELDCWDGPPPNNVIIYHGYTLTSKLPFVDVLNTIKEYAFVTSDYPVILSIEDNCSLPYQRRMAHEFKVVFGESLLVAPVHADETVLPSPECLKFKIILKHKKLPRDTDRLLYHTESNASMDDGMSTAGDVFESTDTQHRGLLRRLDEMTGEWHAHIFNLTSQNLLCSMPTETLDDNEEGPSSARQPRRSSGGTDDDMPSGPVNTDELHISELWYHGDISREDAVKLFRRQPERVDGMFLVRKSEVFRGDHTISFVFRSKFHHCRIATCMEQGERRHYVNEGRKFESLYELISYYQQKDLITQEFRLTLTTPCPQPNLHENYNWYAGDIASTAAEQLLNQVPVDGAFLVRKSQTDSSGYTLSFRVDGSIRHCRLKQEGRLFLICQSQFENLVSLVEYFSRHALYHNVSLKYPVNEETIANYQSTTSHLQAPGSYMELEDVKVRARYAYTAANRDELTFPANALISLVSKDDDNWWVGEYNGKRGLLPAPYVEPESKNTVMSTGSAPIDVIPLMTCTCDRVDEVLPTESDAPPMHYVFRLTWHRPLVVPGEGACKMMLAASSAEDRDDWLNNISQCALIARQHADAVEKKSRELRIASELSVLVIYCQAVSFAHRTRTGNVVEMCSYSEVKHSKHVEHGIVSFNQKQISRVYPSGTRVTSSNFNPMPMWNAGCHMVALNYQTDDKPMQVNQGRFRANGQCGFVLKPNYMMQSGFDPSNHATIGENEPITLTVRIIAGRHLSRRDRSKSIVSPYVDVELLGFDFDSTSYRTPPVDYNGLNPVFEHTLEFSVYCPEVALLRFCVQDEDFISSDPFIGQATLPLDCVRTGFRSVPLLNRASEPLDLSCLLVHVDIHAQTGGQAEHFGLPGPSTAPCTVVDDSGQAGTSNGFAHDPPNKQLSVATPGSSGKNSVGKRTMNLLNRLKPKKH